jgi:hypothetical protein
MTAPITAIPDTITITEYFHQDAKSSGAEIRCAFNTSSLRGHLNRLNEISRGLADPDKKDIETFLHHVKSENEIWGCSVAVVVLLAIFAGFRMISSPETFLLQTILLWAGGLTIVLVACWYLGRTKNCEFRVICQTNAAVERTLEILRDKFSDVSINRTDWRYQISTESLTDWSLKCIKHANVRAKKIADELGVDIDGVHSYLEVHQLPEKNYPQDLNEIGGVRPAIRARVADAETFDAMGDSFLTTGSERTGARIQIQYKIIKRQQTAPA